VNSLEQKTKKNSLQDAAVFIYILKAVGL